MSTIKAAFFNTHEYEAGQLSRVYGHGRREQLAERVDLYPHVITPENFGDHLAALADIEAVFTTWGMYAPPPELMAAMGKLRAVFYAAGSVKPFAEPFLSAGVTVVSAWAANAVPVAEFTLAQILLGCKGYWRNMRSYTYPGARHEQNHGPGVYGDTIALIGAGQIGRRVVDLLKPFRLRVLMVDPYLSDEQAREMGVELVDLHEAFERALVVSNHLPNLPHLRGVLDKSLFGSMRPGATFINTGRGAQVNEDDLIAILQQREDLTALLDVTHPEPPVAGSPFYELPNVHLTTHIAGSLGDEVLRMADYVIEEFDRWRSGQELRYAVTLDMLETMA